MDVLKIKKNINSRLKLTLILTTTLMAVSCATPVQEEGWAFSPNSGIKAASIKCRIFDQNQALRYVINWKGEVYNPDGIRVGMAMRNQYQAQLVIDYLRGLKLDDGTRVTLNTREMNIVMKSGNTYFHTCRRRGEVFT